MAVVLIKSNSYIVGLAFLQLMAVLYFAAMRVMKVSPYIVGLVALQFIALPFLLAVIIS